MEQIAIPANQGAFLENVLNGDDLHVAGKKAGFANPSRDAYPVLTHPEVIRRFQRVIKGKAATQGLVVCYNYLVEVVQDKTRPDRMRLDAAKFLYGHHMPAVKAEEGESTKTKEINEMSNHELHEYISAMEQKLAARLLPSQEIDSLI